MKSTPDRRRASSRSDVPPFQVMEVFKQATRRQATHGDLILLCVGQPGTPAPRPVIEAVHAAVESQTLGYTDPAGILPLRETIAQHYATAYGIEVHPDEVLVSNGSSGGFSSVILAAFEPGARIAMPRPGYPANRSTIQALGCEVVDLECDASTRFQPTVAHLEALPALPDGLILASPANPTGTIIDADELGAVAQWCEERGVLLLSDEIYHGISYGRRCASAWEFSRESVVMGSMSKYYSMTGWRLGWSLLPRHLQRPVELLQANLSICAPAVSQVGSVAGFTPEAAAELDGHVARYARNRDLLLRRLPELGITSFAPPDGAFYAYCDISHLTNDSLQWCAQMLERTGVALAPGVDFDPVHGHRFMRLSFCGATQEIDEAIDRLAAAL
ncbi:pyridoxal phosphate-dependent aminotransferase [Leekyejoonella antrihumi]|uniref:Aminotransferase n=1 Tax=Leekyejoonella antrihumi TaxID=1660198 RepID=A0A563DY31_9MICO|nr:aminotransferase class I/II-fold pyridoxal phosphate-dependent enzyme [Leekyejoonella antrihumi]TWP34881.1 aminotransferase class I/II-fold pyridoxal phosphate-dependent enzyme [Leekyejoonella antrihumi]